MKVGVLQMEIADGQPDENLQQARSLLEASPVADLYLLPELWSTGYVHDRWAGLADSATPRMLEELGRLAQERAAWLAGSMIARTEDAALANRFFLLDRQGAVAGFYDKAHLFRPMREHEFLRPGREVPIFSVEGVRVAPGICYDLRFPGMFARAAERGVDLFLVPSEWPNPRCHVLQVLAHARAVENQCYLALSNRVGRSLDGTDFCGGSRVIDPLGGDTVVPGASAGVVVAELDPGLLQSARSDLRIFEERVAGVD